MVTTRTSLFLISCLALMLDATSGDVQIYDRKNDQPGRNISVNIGGLNSGRICIDCQNQIQLKKETGLDYPDYPYAPYAANPRLPLIQVLRKSQPTAKASVSLSVSQAWGNLKLQPAWRRLVLGGIDRLQTRPMGTINRVFMLDEPAANAPSSDSTSGAQRRSDEPKSQADSAASAPAGDTQQEEQPAQQQQANDAQQPTAYDVNLQPQDAYPSQPNQDFPGTANNDAAAPSLDNYAGNSP